MPFPVSDWEILAHETPLFLSFSIQAVSACSVLFTVRLRLGNLLKSTNPQGAIDLFNEVLEIDPLRLGVNAMIGDAYQLIAKATSDPVAQAAVLQQAVEAYQAELALSPVTPQSIALTGDLANNAHVHWSLAQIYQQLGDLPAQASELNLYLEATQWHSDTYAWRIQLARNRLASIQAQLK